MNQCWKSAVNLYRYRTIYLFSNIDISDSRQTDQCDTKAKLSQARNQAGTMKPGLQHKFDKILLHGPSILGDKANFGKCSINQADFLSVLKKHLVIGQFYVL